MSTDQTPAQPAAQALVREWAVIAQLRGALVTVMQHAPGYDWNADHLGLTLIVGTAYAAADSLATSSSALDAASAQEPQGLMAPEGYVCYCCREHGCDDGCACGQQLPDPYAEEQS